MPDASTIPRSVLVRSDQDSGMALIKSKDGRTKWLTVSADPSAPPYSWDDRVRAWASRLGVCAMPPSQNEGQATPLPTPPPLDPRSTPQQDWTIPPSSSSSSSPPALAADGQARAKGSKRAGSFARGFLLGLGGGGAPSASTAKRNSNSTTSPGATCPAARKDADADCAGAVSSDDPVKLTRAQPQQGSGSEGTPETAAAAAAADDNGGGGASDGALLGRKRWVKGAPPSPIEGRNNSSDWSSSADNQSGSDSDNGDMATSGDCRDGLNKIDSTEHIIAGDGIRDNKLQNGDQSRATQESRGGQTQPALLVRGEASTDSHDRNGDEWLHAGNSTGGDLMSSVTSGASSKTAKNKKKKSKAKAKSKAKKATTCTPALEKAPDFEEATLPETHGKKSLNVTFSDVRMVEFTRDVGGCTVPSDGTWGLALGLPFRETMVDVDGYEASKAEILEARIGELTKKQRALCTGETRQFDYRPIGESNPLFSRLGEKERSKVLLDYACFHKEDLEEADSSSSSHTRGSRSDADDLSAYSHKISHSDFVDKSQAETPILNTIRDSRRNSQGCNCATVRADKLNVARLREELNKRGLKVSGSKKDLTKALQEAMRAEEERDGGESHKLCRSEDCQCVRDGVGCHADLCNCCKGPHMGKKDAHGGVCGNPEGVYVFSSGAVKSYRHPFVNAKRAPGRDRERRHSRSDSVCSEHQ